MPVTSTGVVDPASEPLPSSPLPRPPQHFTGPFGMAAHEASYETATLAKDVGTTVGSESGTADPGGVLRSPGLVRAAERVDCVLGWQPLAQTTSIKTVLG